MKALAFLEATRLSAAKGLAEPTIDTLYSACENIAKARLVLCSAAERSLSLALAVLVEELSEALLEIEPAV